MKLTLTQQLSIVQITLSTPWPAVGPVHTYLVKSDPITLVDTGLNMPACREELLAGLKAAGVAVTDIRRVLLTHSHLDHTGLAAWVAEQSGAEVWLHPDEAGKLDSPDWWLEGRNRSLTEAGVPAETQAYMDRWWQRGRQLMGALTGWKPLHDGQRFAFEHGELEAVHLPGHALGHTGFWSAADGVLLGGDHLLDGVTPNPIMEPLLPEHPAAVPHAPHRALTLGMFLAALERVRAMPVKTVLPGHGKVITDHVKVAQSYIHRHEARLNTLRERLGAAGKTPFELTREVYPWVKEVDVFLALSEVLAHLDLLVVRGRATLQPGDAGVRYLPTPDTKTAAAD